MITRGRAAWAIALAIALTGCRGDSASASVGARAASYEPRTEVAVSAFYSDLSPYGRWFDYSPYGWCWTPYGVDADWRPYTEGSWAFTEAGWTWSDDEPWGWIPFHYGRWVFDSKYGWVWVPGSTWAPAWVAWRYSDDWVGWAPLPPVAGWNATFGLTFRDARRIPDRAWCFVPPARLLDRDVRRTVAAPWRNGRLFDRTQDATRFSVREGRPMNHGIDPGRIERATGHRIETMRLRDASAPVRGRPRVVADGALSVYRPHVHGNPRQSAPAPQWRQPPPAPLARDRGRERWRNDVQRPGDRTPAPAPPHFDRPAFSPQRFDRPPAPQPRFDRPAFSPRRFDRPAAPQPQAPPRPPGRLSPGRVWPQRPAPRDPARNGAPDGRWQRPDPRDRGDGHARGRDHESGNGRGHGRPW